MNFRTRDNRVYHSSLGSFQEVKGYIQDYLTLLEKKAFMDEDKTELYLLFSSCLEVRAPPQRPPAPRRGRVLLQGRRTPDAAFCAG